MLRCVIELGEEFRRLTRVHFDSRGAGWRSLDLELLSVDAEAERVELPAIGAQLIDLQTHGTRLVSSRRRSGWATGLLGPGSLSTTAPGATSSLRWSSPTGDDHVTQIRLLIPAPTMTRVASEAFGDSAGRFRPPDGLAFDDDVLRALLTRLHRAARVGVSELYAATAAEFIAVHLLTNHGNAPAPPRPARDDARVARAVDLLHDRLDRPVTLAELAAEAGLSRFHLLRLFRQQTGETPARLHQRLRLDLARRLLRTTSLTVAAVAHRCGFADQSHFAKAFRRQVGASPTGYRADARRPSDR